MKIVSKSIDIVVVFNSNGDIKPIRFKFNDNGSDVVIKIDNIIEVNKSNFAGESSIIYRCQSFIDTIETVYEIKYNIRTCRWYLYKI